MESETVVSKPQEHGDEKMKRKQDKADPSVPAGKGDGDNGNGIDAGKVNEAVEVKGNGAGASKENEAGSEKSSEAVNEKGKQAAAGKKREFSGKKRNLSVTEKGNARNDQGTVEGDCIRKDASGSNKFKKKREQANYKNGGESAPEKSDDKGQSGQGNSWKHGKNRKNNNEYNAHRKYEKEKRASPDSPSEKPGSSDNPEASDAPPEKHGRVTPEERKAPFKGDGKRSPSLAPDGPHENRGHPNLYRGQESPVTFDEFLRLLGEGGFTVRRDVYRRKLDLKDSLAVPSWICVVHADKRGTVYFKGVGASNRARTLESSYKHPSGQKYTYLFPEGAIDNATFDLMRYAKWNGLVVPPLKQFCFVTIDPNVLLQDGNLVGRPLWRNVVYPADLHKYERMERLSGEVKLNQVKLPQNVCCRSFLLALEKCVKKMEKTRKFGSGVGDDKGLPVENGAPIPTNEREEETHVHEWDLPREVVERDTPRYLKAELDEVGTSAGGQRDSKGESVANDQGEGPKAEPEEIPRKIQPTVDDGKAVVQVAAPVQAFSVKDEKIFPEDEKHVKWSEETEQSTFNPEEMIPAANDTKASESDIISGSEGENDQPQEGNSLGTSKGTGPGGLKQSPKILSGGHAKPGDEDESAEVAISEPSPADSIAADVDPELTLEERKNGLALQEGADEIGTASAATSDDAVKNAMNIDEDVVDARSVKQSGDGVANKQNPVKDGNSSESGTTETQNLPHDQSAFSRDDGAGNEIQSPAAGDNVLFGLLALFGVIAVFCNWALPFIYTVLGIFSSFFSAVM